MTARKKAPVRKRPARIDWKQRHDSLAALNVEAAQQIKSLSEEIALLTSDEIQNDRLDAQKGFGRAEENERIGKIMQGMIRRWRIVGNIAGRDGSVDVQAWHFAFAAELEASMIAHAILYGPVPRTEYQYPSFKNVVEYRTEIDGRIIDHQGRPQ